MAQSIRTAIWDIETDGLLDRLTRVHILVVRDYERRITHRFRRNDVEDTIDAGLDLLEDAEINVGHNTIQFDIPALEKVYEDVRFNGITRDTLVMSRMLWAAQKDRDFRLFEAGKLPGALIGQHNLKAWGYRLGLQKGDYADVKEAEAKALGITDPDEIARFVWGTWNQEMDDYAVNDVDVTTMLWAKAQTMNWNEDSIRLESQIHDLMGQQERNGICFNVPAAEALRDDLDKEAAKVRQTSIDHYGKWWAPARKHIIKALWDDPEGKNKAKKYQKPRPEFGEDASRAVWGDVFVPKKTMNFKDPLRASRIEGAAYCPVVMKEFNPGSREQIVDRFSTVYKWHPVDFTDTGRPEVSDDVLRKLVGHIPMALELAELFYYNKRLGQLADGPQAWLKKVTPAGKIHHYCNVGGTISGRASHVGPNLAQVPRVVVKKGIGILKGRAGDHGWDCRNLFGVPEGWMQVGVDLSGIELRCFGEQLAKYDQGAYLEIILSSDIHTYNMNAAELTSRDDAKTFIYALIYGAGDVKLGSIVAPLADEDEQREIGKKLRARFMANLPAFAKVVRDIQKMAKMGFLPGLDGRRLYVRSKHSALNTKLQSDAAIIAKKWVCLTEELLLDAGLHHGWDGDFVQLLWIHDEDQNAANIQRDPMLAEFIRETSIKAAAMAGKFFGYVCPIDAAGKIGQTWASTH